MSSPEQLRGGPEHTEQLSEAAAEQAEKIRQKYEQAGEHITDNEHRASAERVKVEALFSKERSAGEQKTGGEPSGVAKAKTKMVSKETKKVAYQKTMTHIQSEMNPVSRNFSKIIHTPAIEKTSDFIGNTVARPHAILAGSFTAFLLTLSLYTLARTMGFALSGFEMIGSFIIGWILGITFDFLRVMVTGRTR